MAPFQVVSASISSTDWNGPILFISWYNIQSKDPLCNIYSLLAQLMADPVTFDISMHFLVILVLCACIHGKSLGQLSH